MLPQERIEVISVGTGPREQVKYMVEDTGIHARARYVAMSPQKIRKVIDLVRGMGANSALDVLQFTPNAAAKPVRKVLHSAIANAEENFGFNALTGEIEDLMAAGIVDPVKTVCAALRNAASIAGTMLTTQAVVTEIPEEEVPPSAPHHHG